MEAKDFYDLMTPAHWAAMRGQTEALRCLKELGANVNDIYDRYNTTPVQLATQHGHTEALKYLVEEAKVDKNTIDALGRTLLDWAISGKDTEMGNILRENGAKTGEELRKEEKQEDTLERAGRPCDNGNKGPSR